MSNSILSNRLARLRALLAAHDLDALLLANYQAHSPQGGDYSFYYATNLYNRYLGYTLITADDCAAWVEASEVTRAKEDSWLAQIGAMEPGEQPFLLSGDEFAGMVLKHARAMTGKAMPRFGISGRCLHAAVGVALAQAGAPIVDVSTALEKARMVKDELEIPYMREGCRLADLGVTATMEALRPGITERQLAARAEYEMKKNGADCFWWKTLMSSGPRAERWMISPSDRVIEAGDLVVTDFTPVYRGYAGDIARSFVCGKASAAQLEVFGLARAALDAAGAAVQAGVSAGELMRAGAQAVGNSPYEPFYAGSGHGIGLYDDTYPIFLATNEQMKTLPRYILDETFPAGSIVAIEIIFTVPGLGGCRLEDNYLVQAGGAELLTHAPLVAEV